MNAEDLRELAERATGVEGRPTTRLEEVHSRIRSLRRRRQAGAVAATVVAVVLALSAGSAVVKLTDADPPPVTPPSPSPKPNVDEDVPGVRPLVWARGSTIHVGDKTIDVGGEVAGVAATDDGAVFTLGEKVPRGCTESVGDCGSALWFTDGSDKSTRIGRVFGTVVRGYRVEVSTVGSTVVWFEPSQDRRVNDGSYREVGQYVVYDTGRRHEVARFGSAASNVKGVYDDYVYWIPDDKDQEWCADYSKYYGACRRYTAVMRLETSTGTPAKVPWSAFTSDRRNRPRTFVRQTSTPDYPYNPFPSGRPGDVTLEFGRDGDRLVVVDANGDAVGVRLAETGQPVRLRLPRDYHADVELFFFQMWLDDDRIALAADNREDILTCRLANGRCRIVVRGPTDYGFGGHG